MNDDEMLATMRGSLTGVTESLTDVHLELPVTTIQARARNRRLRRGLAGAGTTGLALGIGLALAAGVGSPAGARSPASASSLAGARPVHVNLDAWSVNTLSSGLVYVDVRALQDPAKLRQTLAAAGVPAIVTFGEFCTTPNGGDYQHLSEVVGKAPVDGEARLTIDPAGIPDGSELSIGILSASKQGTRALNAEFTLVQKGTQLTCSRPDPNPSGVVQKGPENHTGSSAGNIGVKVGTSR